MYITALLRSLTLAFKTLIVSLFQLGGLLKPLIPLSESQWTKLNLLKTLVQRDLAARNKGSILGNLWPLLTQLAQLLIYTYVFAVVLRVKLSLRGMPADNSLTFGLWLFAGLLPWTAFSNGINRASRTVITQSNLVKKVVFPLTLLPLVPVCTSFVESTFGIMALVVFVMVVNHSISPALLLLPLVWLPQLLLTAGVGFLTSGLTVFIRDIPQTLVVVLNLWFYATPIIYPAEMIPQPFQTWVFWLNPLATIGEMYRDSIILGDMIQWSKWAIATGISTIVCLSGLWCYRKLRPAFADVL